MPPTIQTRDVRDLLHDELEARAARAGTFLSGYLLEIVRRAAERARPGAMLERRAGPERAGVLGAPLDPRMWLSSACAASGFRCGGVDRVAHISRGGVALAAGTGTGSGAGEGR